jgi:hypothetical protein
MASMSDYQDALQNRGSRFKKGSAKGACIERPEGIPNRYGGSQRYQVICNNRKWAVRASAYHQDFEQRYASIGWCSGQARLPTRRRFSICARHPHPRQWYPALKKDGWTASMKLLRGAVRRDRAAIHACLTVHALSRDLGRRHRHGDLQHGTHGGGRCTKLVRLRRDVCPRSQGYAEP